jgi:membrane AbrB-like protein
LIKDVGFMQQRTTSSITCLLLTFLVAFLGGWLFFMLSLPLPWVLGAMAAILIWKVLLPPPAKVRPVIKNGALVVLGVVFGLQFTRSTIQQVAPYLLPYLVITALTIGCCIVLGILFARWTETDKISSIFGFIPGGLTEMVVTGQAVGANPGTVVFLQTIRLLSVLSVVPFLVTVWFTPPGEPPALNTSPTVAAPLTGEAAAYLWYALPAFGAWLLRKVVPASYVLVPMLMTALLHIMGIPLHVIPQELLVFSQIVVGIGLGESVSYKDLRAVGRQWWRVLALVAAMIVLSMALGVALNVFTGMSMSTALLSVAPGGLIEMALTASSVGADAAVVTSLQMVRLFTIIGAVPFLLKLWFKPVILREEVKVLNEK